MIYIKNDAAILLTIIRNIVNNMLFKDRASNRNRMVLKIRVIPTVKFINRRLPIMLLLGIAFKLSSSLPMNIFTKAGRMNAMNVVAMACIPDVPVVKSIQKPSKADDNKSIVLPILLGNSIINSMYTDMVTKLLN